MPSALVFVAGPFPPPHHGAAVVTSRIASELERVADVRRLDLAPPPESCAVVYHLSRLARATRAAFRVALTRRPRPAVLYMALDDGFGLIYNLMLAVAARAAGHSISIHHHSFRYIDQGSRLMGLLLLICGRSVRQIFLCRTMRRRFDERFGERGRSVVLSNYALLAADVPSTAAGGHRRDLDGRIVLGMLSNLTPEKGADTFLDLIERAHGERLLVKGILAGPIYAPELRKRVLDMADRLGSDTLDWRGPVHGPEKDRFFAEVDAFVFPSRYRSEAQPLVLVEALSRGLPVVTTGRGCNGDDLTAPACTVLAQATFVEECLALLRQWRAEPRRLAEAAGLARPLALRLAGGRRSGASAVATILADGGDGGR